MQKTPNKTTGKIAADKIENNRSLILAARKKGRLATLATYTRLSGPGWLQSATTLGSGSLSSSLYLGVLAGFSLLWLQPLAMIFGIIMLSSIAYVTLSSGQRPFRAINEHINPVLGWGWLIASLLANLVWSMPQYALGTAAIQQNLFKNIIGQNRVPDPWGKMIVGFFILAICITFVMFYNRSSRGIRIFEIFVKTLVSIIVLCFFGVVIKLTIEGQLDWAAVIKGFKPDLRLLSAPAETFAPFIESIDLRFRQFWVDSIVQQQRDVIISAASTAVGINMTFLLPYSMLKKKWDSHFRGLAIFDLSTGLFIPFVIAISCVIIASASQFHTIPAGGFLGGVDENGQLIKPAENLVIPYQQSLESRLNFELGNEAYNRLSETEKSDLVSQLPLAEKRMAAMLVKRDAFNLAEALAPFTTEVFSQYIFGLGILGMALGAITMLMLINGFVICEMLNLPPEGWPHRIGALMVSIGVLGPFFWQEAKLWLAIPTSMFAMVLLPIAYYAFYMLMNNRPLLGKRMPGGGKRITWNILMAVAAGFATIGSLWSLWSKLRWIGIAIFAAFTAMVFVAHFLKKPRRTT